MRISKPKYINLFEQPSPKRKFELLEQLNTVLADEQYAKEVKQQ